MDIKCLGKRRYKYLKFVILNEKAKKNFILFYFIHIWENKFAEKNTQYIYIS